MILNKLLHSSNIPELKNQKDLKKSSGEDSDTFLKSKPEKKSDMSYLQYMKEQIKRDEEYQVKESKSQYYKHLISEMTSKGFMWGIGGFLLLSNMLNPIAAAATGAITGALLAWDKIRGKDKGTVTIDIDGRETKKPYYMNPNIYEKSSEEEAIIEKSRGEDSDKIYPLDIKAKDMPENINKEVIQTLKPYADKLLSLGKERRLVASFGRKSSGGKEILNLIDANMAKNLIASGKSVYVVNATDIKEIPHHYSTTALNKERSVYASEAKDFLEKSFNYTLDEIKAGEDLARIKDGKGIPQGMWGVHENGSSCKEILYNKDQYGSAKLERTRNSNSEYIGYTSSENSKVGLETVEITEETIKKLKSKIKDDDEVHSKAYRLDLIGDYYKGSVLSRDVLTNQLKVMFMMKDEDVDNIINQACKNGPMETTDVRPRVERMWDLSGIGTVFGIGAAEALVLTTIIPMTAAVPACIAMGIGGYKLGKYLTDKVKLHI